MTELYRTGCDECGAIFGYMTSHPRGYMVCVECGEKAEQRQEEADERAATETGTADLWLIRKRGYYYRPDRAGYTSSIADAGRYSEAEAKAEAAIEPAIMQAIPLSQALNEAAENRGVTL